MLLIYVDSNDTARDNLGQIKKGLHGFGHKGEGDGRPGGSPQSFQSRLKAQLNADASQREHVAASRALLAGLRLLQPWGAAPQGLC